jgi:hypothetical protein
MSAPGDLAFVRVDVIRTDDARRSGNPLPDAISALITLALSAAYLAGALAG